MKTTIIISPKSNQDALTLEQGKELKDKLYQTIDPELYEIVIIGVPIDVNTIDTKVQVSGKDIADRMGITRKGRF